MIQGAIHSGYTRLRRPYHGLYWAKSTVRQPLRQFHIGSLGGLLPMVSLSQALNSSSIFPRPAASRYARYQFDPSGDKMPKFAFAPIFRLSTLQVTVEK